MKNRSAKGRSEIVEAENKTKTAKPGMRTTPWLLLILTRYKKGRNWDYLMLMGVPFECDLCHFWNTNRRDPVWKSLKDMDTLEL